ncbi:MAG: HAD hydrolase family protein [Pyrinomonadaceae bacterium]|nr:HAD hydrolase family protein [Phycisphaerales bacterium]
MSPMFTSPSDITLLALDVDGVLTDGSIYIDDLGRETKRFNVRDGFAIRVWARMGFETAIITGRTGTAVQHRAADLKISEVIQGSKDKAGSLALLVERTGVPADRMAFLGDDWPDLSVMKKVGYPIAVADADPAILAIAAHTTRCKGGHGAVREAVEHLLMAKGLFEKAIGMYG